MGFPEENYGPITGSQVGYCENDRLRNGLFCREIGKEGVTTQHYQRLTISISSKKVGGQKRIDSYGYTFKYLLKKCYMTNVETLIILHRPFTYIANYQT